MHNFQWFLEQARSVHGDKYEYNEQSYVNTRVKTPIFCKRCQKVFFQTPKNHLKGQGCPICGKEYAQNCHKHDYETFMKNVEKRFGAKYEFPYIQKEYENSHSKITVKCRLCNNTFTKIACDVITSKTGGCWCDKKESQPTITYNSICEKLNGFDIEYFEGERSICKGKVRLTCQTCGYSYDALISSILKGKCKCRACCGREGGNSRRIAVEEIKNRLNEKFPTILIDYNTYVNTQSPVKCKCKICGHEFERTPNCFFNKFSLKYSPCPKCAKMTYIKKRFKTTDCFIADMKEKYGNDLYTLIGEYNGSDKKVKIRCNDCGQEFEIEANSFLQGHGCPYHNITSVMENEIRDFLTTNNITFETEKTFGWLIYKSNMFLDFYLPDYNVGIECQGIQHFTDSDFGGKQNLLETIQNRDKAKKELCEEHGVKLFYYANYHMNFPYDVYENKENMLKNIKKFNESAKK